jgi:hypothetical protein
MLNLSRIVRSPRFRQTLLVYRNSGKFGPGGWIADTEQQISTIGVAWPSREKEIEQVPEADRVKEMVSFATVDPLLITNEDGLSDQVLYHDERYKIVSILDYSDYGVYVSIGARLAGI